MLNIQVSFHVFSAFSQCSQINAFPFKNNLVICCFLFLGTSGRFFYQRLVEFMSRWETPLRHSETVPVSILSTSRSGCTHDYLCLLLWQWTNASLHFSAWRRDTSLERADGADQSVPGAPHLPHHNQGSVWTHRHKKHNTWLRWDLICSQTTTTWQHNKAFIPLQS